MSLLIGPDEYQSLCAHAERTYPQECCGLLLGQDDRSHADVRLVEEVRPVENAWGTEAEDALSSLLGDTGSVQNRSKADRYWIDPKEMLEAQRYARDRQRSIIGIYHSHPDHPAVPSECDRALAWTGYSYLIISVRQGQVQDLLSWRLTENRHFQSESITTIPTISAVSGMTTNDKIP